jgi:ABC-2 type transport system permease protein
MIVAASTDVAAGSRAPIRDERRPGMIRLTLVELRKAFDTRSGFWLPIGVAMLAIATTLISALSGPAANHTFATVFGDGMIPTAILMPLIGVLLVTSEFSQRTALTTFTLVPSRRRVTVAKLLASVACSIVALAFRLLVAAAATALHHRSGAGVWSLHPLLIAQAFFYLATAMITGVAFGAALLVSAPAIVVYLLLPTAWAALVGSIHALHGAAQWLDPTQSLAPMVRHSLSGLEWTRAAATLALWTALPLAIGWRRIMRRDLD